MTMSIRFWGVRGSIATPGPETARVGGNTSCVEVQCGETTIVLDAGTGIRALGNALMKEGRAGAVTLLLSHLHWDHIQGLPFFVPAYLPSTRLEIMGPGPERTSVADVLADQMRTPVFPVRLQDLAAQLTMKDLEDGDTFEVGDATVTVASMNHPGGCLAYRIEYQGFVVVYATDTEMAGGPGDELIELARGADVLIVDAQYTAQEYASKKGWGHSTWQECCELAREAGVGELVLFHHDPMRNDEAVAVIEHEARKCFSSTRAAREGDRIVLERLADAA